MRAWVIKDKKGRPTDHMGVSCSLAEAQLYKTKKLAKEDVCEDFNETVAAVEIVEVK